MKMRWNIPAVVARVCNPWRRARMNAGHGLKTRATLCDGLTFLEVMFAVIILGIGFIMLAAIFPVAMQQQQAALESSQADVIFDSATATLTQLAGQKISSHSTPTQGPFSSYDNGGANRVYDFDDDSWNEAVGGNVIDAANPHYAWTALYMRGGPSGNPDSNVTIYLFALASRNRSTFEPSEVVRSTAYKSDLEPLPIHVKLTWHDTDASLYPAGTPTSQMTLNTAEISADTSSGQQDASGAVCEGAYVVIRNNGGAGAPAGTVIRLAQETQTAGKWLISPDNDLAGSSDSTGTVQAWILGRGYKDYTNPADGFAGNCQVIGFQPPTATQASINITVPGY